MKYEFMFGDSAISSLLKTWDGGGNCCSCLGVWEKVTVMDGKDRNCQYVSPYGLSHHVPPTGSQRHSADGNRRPFVGHDLYETVTNHAVVV